MTYFYRRYPRGQRGNGIGLKGVFPSTAIARDAEVANPQPYIVNDSDIINVLFNI